MSSIEELDGGIFTERRSNAMGELLLAAESVDADLEWLIMVSGGGDEEEEEGVGETVNLCWMLLAEVEGRIKAISPFGNLVGTNCTPALAPALRKMPFCVFMLALSEGKI